MTQVDEGQLHRLAERACAEFGVELWQLSIKPGPSRRRLIVTIDKEDGVGLEDCEAVSRFLEQLLDQRDAVDGAYVLEVQSPGPERELRGPDDVSKFIDRQVRVELKPSIAGRRRFTGRLCKTDDPSVVELQGVDGQPHRLAWLEIERLQLTGRD